MSQSQKSIISKIKRTAQKKDEVPKEKVPHAGARSTPGDEYVPLPEEKEHAETTQEIVEAVDAERQEKPELTPEEIAEKNRLKVEKIKLAAIQRKAIYSVFPRNLPVSVIKAVAAHLDLDVVDWTNEELLHDALEPVCEFIAAYQELDPLEVMNADNEADLSEIIRLYKENDRFFTITQKMLNYDSKQRQALRTKNFMSYLHQKEKSQKKAAFK